jgi:hypothetical protein
MSLVGILTTGQKRHRLPLQEVWRIIRVPMFVFDIGMNKKVEILGAAISRRIVRHDPLQHRVRYVASEQ